MAETPRMMRRKRKRVRKEREERRGEGGPRGGGGKTPPGRGGTGSPVIRRGSRSGKTPGSWPRGRARGYRIALPDLKGQAISLSSVEGGMGKEQGRLTNLLFKLGSPGLIRLSWCIIYLEKGSTLESGVSQYCTVQYRYCTALTVLYHHQSKGCLRGLRKVSQRSTARERSLE